MDLEMWNHVFENSFDDYYEWSIEVRIYYYI